MKFKPLYLYSYFPLGAMEIEHPDGERLDVSINMKNGIVIVFSS